MYRKKKDVPPNKSHSGKSLAKYGLFDIPSDLTFNEDGLENDDEDDSDLEAELLALTSNSDLKAKSKTKPKVKLSPATDLQTLVAECLKDDVDDLSGDENDPDLLNELQYLTQNVEKSESEVPVDENPVKESSSTGTVMLLEDRLTMYIKAEENAKKSGESSRARRFNRGIKTLQNLIKDAKNGKQINNEDIPPEVAVTVTKKADVLPEISTVQEEAVQPESVHTVPENPVSDKSLINPPSKVDEQLIKLLTDRKDQYKIAAVKLKRSGDIPSAVNYMKISKQFEVILQAVQKGEKVDLSQMPEPPVDIETNKVKTEQKQENEIQGNVEVPAVEDVEVTQEELITAGSVEEALLQRLQVYKKQEESAKNEGNSSKMRRMGRIVKQYEQAIKLHQSGKAIPVDDLPTPPGYAPIPINLPAASAPQPAPSSSKPQPSADPTSPPKPPPRANSVRKTGNQVTTTHLEKQVAMLLARQKEFKDAALKAKQKGEIAQAKELLRTAKGFDKVIDAARSGLPVDMDSLPIPASSRSVLEESFEIVLAEECKEHDTGTLEMLTRLEEQLTKQLKMCLTTRDHHKALGDVSGVNRFENLALNVTRDLDIVRLAYKNGDAVPKYHYENKSFSIVKCFTDLADNDVELSILRGINYNCLNPKDVDTFVKIEFPYPQEEPYRERTVVIKDTNNPEYNATFTIPIQRASRACLRVFKRHSVKCEVYSRGCSISDWACCFSGFFRSDQLLGTVTVKLQPLETQCELHDSFDLMDGRKKVGGKLEVRIRVRHPMVARQVEQINEKWLVLNH